MAGRLKNNKLERIWKEAATVAQLRQYARICLVGLKKTINITGKGNVLMYGTLALDGGQWSASCPSHFTPGERDPQYPLAKRMGGPRAGLDVVECSPAGN
jgi:hypothetical protein